MIRVKLKGARKVADKIRAITTKMPKEMDGLGRYITADVKRGAKYREMAKRVFGGVPSKGWLQSSINNYKAQQDKNHVVWGVGIGIDALGNINPFMRYANIQERGITGWHFVRKAGAGRFGVGYSALGGSLPKAGGKHFFRDAVISTRLRLPNIIAAWEKRMVKG